ncbi:MAG: PP2C family protein-serine/threonine phosphatase [Planctomycetota bacterium]|nr:PP2C family protein-serine/threonine phosphatase [Planctomycetota bacterium]
MDRAESLSAVEVPASFTDVLYLTNQRTIPIEIRRLFKQKKLSYRHLPIGRFSEVRDRPDLIGTVVIDAKGSVTSQQQLARIIESLETEHIGVVLLTGPMKTPVRSFSLSPTRTSFCLTSTTDGVSMDEFWTRVSVNLACRKGGTSIPIKLALPERHVHTVFKNKLEERLNMTKTLAENLTEQLRLAGLVQQDFLPSKLPNNDETQWATVFLPAEWVSGDIYDVVRIDEQHIGFYVADVVGHGMPAALLTIFLKQALVMRETIANNYRVLSPAEVVKNLNLRMTAQKLSGYQFATCCYCLLNIKTLQLTYARAGHPYPIVVRLGEQPKQLEVRGSLLGIFEQAEYLQETVQLQPGDKVLLYSDGAEPFIGSFNDQGCFCFNEEFCKTTDQPIVDMMDSFNTLMKNREIKSSEIDDITMLGLEILPSIADL